MRNTKKKSNMIVDILTHGLFIPFGAELTRSSFEFQKWFCSEFWLWNDVVWIIACCVWLLIETLIFGDENLNGKQKQGDMRHQRKEEEQRIVMWYVLSSIEDQLHWKKSWKLKWLKLFSSKSFAFSSILLLLEHSKVKTKQKLSAKAEKNKTNDNKWKKLLSISDVKEDTKEGNCLFMHVFQAS